VERLQRVVIARKRDVALEMIFDSSRHAIITDRNDIMRYFVTINVIPH